MIRQNTRNIARALTLWTLLRNKLVSGNASFDNIVALHERACEAFSKVNVVDRRNYDYGSYKELTALVSEVHELIECYQETCGM